MTGAQVSLLRSQHIVQGNTNLLRCQSLFIVHLEHFANQVLRLKRNIHIPARYIFINGMCSALIQLQEITYIGNSKSPDLIFLNNIAGDDSKNGNCPYTIMYNITPSAHTSIGLPRYGLPLSTSGEMYAGDPRWSDSRSLSLSKNLPKQKLTNVTRFVNRFRMMLPSFRSR